MCTFPVSRWYICSFKNSLRTSTVFISKSNQKRHLSSRDSGCFRFCFSLFLGGVRELITKALLLPCSMYSPKGAFRWALARCSDVSGLSSSQIVAPIGLRLSYDLRRSAYFAPIGCSVFLGLGEGLPRFRHIFAGSRQGQSCKNFPGILSLNFNQNRSG